MIRQETPLGPRSDSSLTNLETNYRVRRPRQYADIVSGRPPEPRQCGRCRLVFPGDPTLDAHAISYWWLCPPCRTAFFGDDDGRKQAARWD
jgi:hypothetical protein